MSYEVQRRLSDKYLPAFKEILKQNSMHFLSLEVSDDEKDMTEATDMVIKIEGGDVALRVRNSAIKFRDLTIRSQTRSGNKTELQKLKEGFGDWYLYGWGSNSNIDEYILVDLDRVRKFKLLEKERRQIANGDGTYFVNIGLGELDTCGCIVAKNISERTQNDIDRYMYKLMQSN